MCGEQQFLPNVWLEVLAPELGGAQNHFLSIEIGVRRLWIQKSGLEGES